MVKVMYTGSPQITVRVIPLRDLGEDSDDVLVFNNQNNFTQEVSDAQWEKLQAIAGGFTEIVASEPDENAEGDKQEAPSADGDGAEAESSNDDQAVDPEVPQEGSGAGRKKSTRRQA